MNTHLAVLGITEQFISARGLREYAEAVSLDVAEVAENGRVHLLEPAAAEAWRFMKAAALLDGVDIWIVSAFRSIERQAEIILRKLEAGAAIEDVLAISAPPGFSEHHTGRAVDLTTIGSRPLEIEFEQTAAYTWLIEHAAKYGYALSYPPGNIWGYQYEPWHWCFNGDRLTAQA